jgi:putative hemolysin
LSGRLANSATAPERVIREGRYELSFARTEAELDAVLRLRFEVFNLELGEGLDSSYETGRDEDPFDAVCHHLIIRDTKGGDIVGCYRMQTAEIAEANIGFYSDAEYDLSELTAPVLSQSIEIGRACVARAHRGIRVLFLLWRGLVLYLSAHRKRYLFGCSSLTSQDPRSGLALMAYLRQEGYLHPDLHVSTRPGYECDAGDAPVVASGEELPELFRIYLHHGARVCSPPAIDRRFKTIDFLMLFDVFDMPHRMLRNFTR